MPTDEQITEIEDAAIARAKSGVTSSSTDGVSASFRSASDMLADLEAIEKREAKTAATARSHFGLRFTKLVPPGCG